MTRQRGQILPLFVAIVVLLVLAVIGLMAVCTPGEDDHGLGVVQLVTHYRDCRYDDCGRDDYDQWNSDQRNHNGRNRGSFSPGPFDRSPIEMHDVCVSLDCSGRDKKDDRRDDGSSGR